MLWSSVQGCGVQGSFASFCLEGGGFWALALKASLALLGSGVAWSGSLQILFLVGGGGGWERVGGLGGLEFVALSLLFRCAFVALSLLFRCSLCSCL